MVSPPGLLFDVFGTLVDWRSSISREAREILSPLGVSVPWEAFAEAWRAAYQPALEEVRSGREPYRPLDEIHRRNLEKVIRDLGLGSLEDRTLAALTQAWHRLDAWPDVQGGLSRLRRTFRMAPCSNGNLSLVSDLSRHNRWTWDMILGAEIARDYKPKPSVYLASAKALGCRPEETIMVAAHPMDLQAAGSLGMKTAFVARPREHGTGSPEPIAGMKFDWAVESLPELADRLGGAGWGP
jgi:2-haloacid dehalogenase